MEPHELAEAIADALEAGAETLRRRAREGQASSPLRSKREALKWIELGHPDLGPRQKAALDVLLKYGEIGTDTGVISRTMEYDQSNTYLTLQSLARRGLVEKFSNERPHRYRITDRWRSTDRERSADKS